MLGDSLLFEGQPSLVNYKLLFSDSRQARLFFTSSVISLGVSGSSLIIGLPLAFLIFKTDLLFRKIFRYLYLLPLLIPAYINTIAWINLLSRAGSLNKALMRLLATTEPVISIYSLPGVIFILTLSYFPFITLMVSAGLISIDKGLEDAGRITKGEFGVIKGITLPLLRPYIISGLIFAFIFSFTNYGVPSLLGVNTYPVEIFSQFSAFYNEKAATVIAFPLILISLVLILMLKFNMGKRYYLTLGRSFMEGKPIVLGKWQWLALPFCLVVICLAVILPLVELILTAGPLKIYKIAFKSAYQEVLLSLSLAAISATLILILSLFLSYFVEKTKQRGRGIVDLLTLIPFAIPAPVLGIGLIKIWNRPLTEIIYVSSAMIIMGYIARFIPFTTRVLSSMLKNIDPALEEAAMVSGGSWLRRLFKIVLPLSKPGLVVGWATAFVLCLGELGTALLVLPPGQATLPIRIYTMMHYGAYQLVAALCIIQVGITLFILAVFISVLCGSSLS